MKISESSYYYEPKVSRAEREEQDADLRGKIEEIRVGLPRYGYRMLVPQFKGMGINVGERRVRRVLRKFSLQIRPLKKFVRTTQSDHDCFVYPNLLPEMTIDGQLTLDALEMAISRRNPPRGVIHHSDRGV